MITNVPAATSSARCDVNTQSLHMPYVVLRGHTTMIRIRYIGIRTSSAYTVMNYFGYTQYEIILNIKYSISYDNTKIFWLEFLKIFCNYLQALQD